MPIFQYPQRHLIIHRTPIEKLVAFGRNTCTSIHNFQ